jgi:hypothetical protein
MHRDAYIRCNKVLLLAMYCLYKQTNLAQLGKKHPPGCIQVSFRITGETIQHDGIRHKSWHRTQDHQQDDQIVRIFAYWAIAFFGQVF